MTVPSCFLALNDHLGLGQRFVVSLGDRVRFPLDVLCIVSPGIVCLVYVVTGGLRTPVYGGGSLVLPQLDKSDLVDTP